MKENIDDKKFATVVLGSLPESYENFLTSLNARDYELLSWDDIKPALMEEYMKRKEKTEKQTKNADDALFMRNPGPSRGGGYHFENRSQQNNWRGRGNNRGHGGRGRGNFQGRGGRGGFTRRCYTCDEPGHGYRDCPQESRREEGNMCEIKRRKIDCDDGPFLEEDIALMMTSDSELHSTTNEWFSRTNIF